jgi:hypothetical protein
MGQRNLLQKISSTHLGLLLLHGKPNGEEKFLVFLGECEFFLVFPHTDLLGALSIPGKTQ